jgi:hypothetical protein
LKTRFQFSEKMVSASRLAAWSIFLVWAYAGALLFLPDSTAAKDMLGEFTGPREPTLSERILMMSILGYCIFFALPALLLGTV